MDSAAGEFDVRSAVEAGGGGDRRRGAAKRQHAAAVEDVLALQRADSGGRRRQAVAGGASSKSEQRRVMMAGRDGGRKPGLEVAAVAQLGARPILSGRESDAAAGAVIGRPLRAAALQSGARVQTTRTMGRSTCPGRRQPDSLIASAERRAVPLGRQLMTGYCS